MGKINGGLLGGLGELTLAGLGFKPNPPPPRRSQVWLGDFWAPPPERRMRV